MFTGQIAIISNKATWQSDIAHLVDDEDGSTFDVSAATEIEVSIKDQRGCTIKTGSLADGKVVIIAPGFQWTFQPEDLSRLCAGTYRFGVKLTLPDYVEDLIVGSISVIEGN